MGVVLVQRDDVGGQDFPEGGDKSAAGEGTVQKVAGSHVAILVAPDTGGEPG